MLKVSSLVLYALSMTLQGASIYYMGNVSGANDSNPGTRVSPWATLQGAVNQMNCGDTLNVIANGLYSAGDANLPYFANCTAVTTVQSSALALFAPFGYRTIPARDSANYGKLQFTNQGIVAQPSLYNWNAYYMYSGVSVNTSTGQFTVVSGNGLALGGLANNMQVEFEPQSEGGSNGNGLWLTSTAPGSLSLLAKYWLVNCSSSPACGAVNSTFYLSATEGGSPLGVSTCTGTCILTVSSDPTSGGACTWGVEEYNPVTSTLWYCPGTGTPFQWTTYGANNGGPVYTTLGLPVKVEVSASTFTIGHNWGSGTLVNGIPVAFAAGGLQLVGTLPPPLQGDGTYYTVGVSGSNFQVALVPGGTPITITGPGTGMLTVANINVPNNWAFRGIETAVASGGTPYIFFTLGSNNSTSQYGMTHHIEIDRVYSHDTAPGSAVARNIFNNGRYIFVHDSWLQSAFVNEGQVITCTLSLGPAVVANNFMEAGGEITLCGGDWPAYPGATAYQSFLGNYYYKPPAWKYTTGGVPATGACLYDATDPAYIGGEWYRDTVHSINYVCGSSGTWGSTGASIPAYLAAMTLKNMAEFKSGRYFSYIGNVFNYGLAGAQSGQSWNNSMEYGSGAVMGDDHITVMNNASYNMLRSMVRETECLASATSICPYPPGNHFTINNLTVINPLVCGTSFGVVCGYNPYINNTGPGGNNNPSPFIGEFNSHNTTWVQDSFPYGSLSPMYANSPNGANPPFATIPTTYFVYTNNIDPGDFQGQGDANGNSTIGHYYANSTFLNSVLKGATGTYSSSGTNTIANIHTGGFSTNANIGYVNGTGTMSGDYHLASTSPCSAAAASPTCLSTDGTDVGTDIDVNNLATSGAIAGTPTWNEMYSVQVSSIGSTQAVFSYQRPPGQTCSVNIYSGLARNASANLVSSTADSTGVLDGNGVQVLVTGLTANTLYPWWTVSCSGGTIMGLHPLHTKSSGSVAIQFQLGFSVAQTIEYCPSAAMTGCTTLSAATVQSVPVPANGVRYVAQLVSGSPLSPSILVAP